MNFAIHGPHLDGVWQSTAAAANKLALTDDAVGTSAACAALESAHYRPYVVVAAAAALAPANDVLAVSGANLGLYPSAHAHNPANTIHSPNDGLTLVLVFAGKSKVGGEGGGVGQSFQAAIHKYMYLRTVCTPLVCHIVLWAGHIYTTNTGETNRKPQ